MRRGLFGRGLLLSALTLALLLVPVTATALGAPAQGGSAADEVAPCKDNGFEHVTRTDGSTFRNQGQCVSYVRTGGQLLLKAPPASLVLTESYYPMAECRYPNQTEGCKIDVIGSGLMPGSSVDIYRCGYFGRDCHLSQYWFVDDAGNVQVHGLFNCNAITFGSVTNVEAVGTTASGQSIRSNMIADVAC